MNDFQNMNDYQRWRQCIINKTDDVDYRDGFTSVRINEHGQEVHDPNEAQAYGCGFNMLYFMRLLDRNTTIGNIQNQIQRNNFGMEGLTWSRMVSNFLRYWMAPEGVPADPRAADMRFWARHEVRFDDLPHGVMKINLLSKFFNTLRDIAINRCRTMNNRYCYIPVKAIIQERLSHSVVYMYDNNTSTGYMVDPSKGDQTLFMRNGRPGRNYLNTSIVDFIRYITRADSHYYGLSILTFYPNNIPNAAVCNANIDLREASNQGGVLANDHRISELYMDYLTPGFIPSFLNGEPIFLAGGKILHKKTKTRTKKNTKKMKTKKKKVKKTQNK